MIISRKQMAREKVRKIKNGVAAFAETQEVIDYVKKFIEEEAISVYIDETSRGCWFTPKKEN